jgi:flagellar hook-associated protein 3 FlgL
MFFRVTQHQMSAYARQSIARQTRGLYEGQRQVSSGLRVERASDDPVSMRRALVQRDRIARLEGNTFSLIHTKSRMNVAHDGLRRANTLLQKARDIAINSQELVSQSEVNVLASELDGILDQLLDIANSTDETGFLYGETIDGAPPFRLVDGGDGNAVYAGTTQSGSLELTGIASVTSLIAGNEIFQPNDRGELIVFGNTGVAAGTGTDSAIGRRTLQVSHTLTTYAPGSGVAAGTDSATADTIIGPAGAWTLQINDVSGTGAAGTVSLNGGPEFNFTNTDTNLEVVGPGDQRIYLDTTAITAGFNGTVDITATGTLSVDDGLTTTPITFDANQQVFDSRDGSVVNLNTTAVRRTGTDHLDFDATSDIFGVIQSLRDDILNSRGLSVADQSTALSRGLGEVDRLQDHLLDIVGVQSVSLEQIDRLEVQLDELELAEKVELSDTVSADITGAILQMQEAQAAQQYTMAVIGQFLTPNLLNFIR